MAASTIANAAMLPILLLILISFPRASTSLPLQTPKSTTTILPTSSYSSSSLVVVSPLLRATTRRASLLHHHHQQRRPQDDDDSIPVDDTPPTTATQPTSSPSSSSSSNRKSFLKTLTKTTSSVALLLALQENGQQPAYAAGGDGGGRVLRAGDIDTTNAINGGKLLVGNTGLLESRVNENVLSPPPYGMEASDISFPSYFTGVWNSLSTTSSIQAPCGIALFGGNATYTRAQTETNTSITYKSRFLPSTDSNGAIAIADREFNVAEITKAAMGANAVMEIPIATPNKLSCVLSPNGADGMLVRADLLTLARREEVVGRREFHCSEVVRQIVAPMGGGGNGGLGGGRRPSLVKEVETSSLYTAIDSGGEGETNGGEVKEIRCRQRTATFLVPSQEDPMVYKMWEATRGRPIDVRFYDVVYTKR